MIRRRQRRSTQSSLAEHHSQADDADPVPMRTGRVSHRNRAPPAGAAPPGSFRATGANMVKTDRRVGQPDEHHDLRRDRDRERGVEQSPEREGEHDDADGDQGEAGRTGSDTDPKGVEQRAARHRARPTAPRVTRTTRWSRRSRRGRPRSSAHERPETIASSPPGRSRHPGRCRSEGRRTVRRTAPRRATSARQIHVRAEQRRDEDRQDDLSHSHRDRDDDRGDDRRARTPCVTAPSAWRTVIGRWAK